MTILVPQKQLQKSKKKELFGGAFSNLEKRLSKQRIAHIKHLEEF